jgi:hypothetical protein
MRKQLNEVAKLAIAHVLYLMKKKTSPSSHAIIRFLVPQTHTKKMMNNTINFWKF